MSLPIYCAIFVVILILLSSHQIDGAENESSSIYNVIPLNLSTYDEAENFYNISCKEEEIYDEEINSCRINCSSSLTFSRITNSCLDEDSLKNVEELGINCRYAALPENTFQVFENGSLKLNRSEILFTPEELYYEVDGKISVCFPFTSRFLTCKRWLLFEHEFELYNNGLTLRTIYDESLLEYGEFYLQGLDAAVCEENEYRISDEEHGKVANVYSVAWTISTISLALAILIYFLVYKNMKHQTIISICHMATLFILYFLLMFRAWMSPLSPKVCIPYAVALHYFFLATFFWLNVLAYDIWKNLPRCSSIKLTTFKTEKWHFIFMSLYAWGCPLIIAVITLLVDLFSSPNSKFKPKFEYYCWFVTVETKFLYMYGFAGLILFCNAVFFIITVNNLRKLGNDAEVVNKKIHKQLIRMYLKLMIVMGLTWVMEIMSALMKSTRFWYAIDFVTGLQGFFLFIVYVCKLTVLRKLMTFWRKSMAICCRLCKNCHRNTKSTEPSNVVSSEMQEQSLSGLSSSEFGSNLTILPPSEHAVDEGSVNSAFSSS